MQTREDRNLRDEYIVKLGQAENAFKRAQETITRIKTLVDKLNTDDLVTLQKRGVDALFLKQIDYDKFINSPSYKQEISSKIVTLIQSLRERLDKRD